MVNEQSNIDPPVRISINRVEVVSGALFMANVMTIPIIVFTIIIAVVAMFLIPIWFPNFNASQFLPIVIIVVIVPAICWIANFINGMIFILISNGVMKFNKPKLIMQQI